MFSNPALRTQTIESFDGEKAVFLLLDSTATSGPGPTHSRGFYEGWNFNSGNYLFTTDTK